MKIQAAADSQRILTDPAARAGVIPAKLRQPQAAIRLPRVSGVPDFRDIRTCRDAAAARRVVGVPRKQSAGVVRHFANAAEMIRRKEARHARDLLTLSERPTCDRRAIGRALLADSTLAPDDLRVGLDHTAIFLDDAHAPLLPS